MTQEAADVGHAEHARIVAWLRARAAHFANKSDDPDSEIEDADEYQEMSRTLNVAAQDIEDGEGPIPKTL